MKNLTLHSSHGSVVVNAKSGEVIERNTDGKCYIDDIVRFDVDEFNRWHKKFLGNPMDSSDYDILFFGFHAGDGSYTPADPIREEVYGIMN